MGDAPKSDSNRAAVVLSSIGALVGGWLLSDFVDLKSQNAPWGAVLLVALAAGAAYVFWIWQDRRKRTTLQAPDRSWVAPVAILLVFAGFGVVNGTTARNHYLRLYCMYGSRSTAQLEGCMNHVTTEDVNRLDTQAADFARGDTSDCLYDAGPFCESAAKWNAVDYDPSYP